MLAALIAFHELVLILIVIKLKDPWVLKFMLVLSPRILYLLHVSSPVGKASDAFPALTRPLSRLGLSLSLSESVRSVDVASEVDVA